MGSKENANWPCLLLFDLFITHLVGSLSKELSICTNSSFLIHISLQYDGANLRYFKLKLFNITDFKFEKSKVFDCKEIGIIKYEFLTKTQFL